MKKYWMMVLTAIVATSALTACQNTIHGAGQDIENAGDSVKQAVPPKY